MRITALIRPGSVNANYRARFPLVALQQRGHDVRIESGFSITQAAKYSSCDVVHFCRLWEEPFQRLARTLRADGVGVTLDSDDDLTSIPKGNPGYRRTGGAQGQRVGADMRAMMRLANVVTTPSEVLADRFRSSADDVRVIENYLPPPMILPRRRNHPNTRVVIGWVAGSEHQVDVEQLRLRPLFERLLERNPQLISSFDIAIAPVADIPFNRSRSSVKLKEYAGAGAAWMASAVAPYLGLGEQEGGRVIENNRWLDALQELVDDAAARRRLGERSHRWGQRQSILLHAHRWERAFADAAASARARVSRSA